MGPPDDDARIGATLQGRYRVLERIAAGGMGIVYRGERLQLGRPVAIKFLHAWTLAREQSLRRFEIEARAMSRLSHPNCVSVIDFGVEEAVPYLVMEFVTGTPLRTLIDKGPTPVAEALPIFRQLLAGLAHAHGQGIVHRDVKPENILITDVTGLGGQVKILDFGVAKLLDGSAGLTTGFAVGTPSYMSPEQARFEPVDVRSDVYGAGILLFELLTAQKPFKADGVAELLRLHREAPPPRLASRLPGARFSSALEGALAKALAKEPRDRYQSAAELAAALDAIPEATPAGTSARPTAEESPRMAPRRRLIAAALAGATLVGTVWWLARGRESRPAPEAVVEAPSSIQAAVGRPPSAPPPSEAPAAGQPAVPAGEDLPGIDEVHALIDAGRWQAAVKALVTLRKQHPESAYAAYLLGNLYLQKLWGQEGFEAYRAAVRLNPAYRQDPTIIRNAIRSFASDRHAWRGAAFLREEVGAAAIPYLEEVARSQVTGVRQWSQRLLAELR